MDLNECLALIKLRRNNLGKPIQSRRDFHPGEIDQMRRNFIPDDKTILSAAAGTIYNRLVKMNCDPSRKIMVYFKNKQHVLDFLNSSDTLPKYHPGVPAKKLFLAVSIIMPDELVVEVGGP